jgi:hypothetical protein
MPFLYQIFGLQFDRAKHPEQAAEAYMSLGNASSLRDGERLFRLAILYLRQASNIPGFLLPAHFQRYAFSFTKGRQKPNET